MPNAKPAPQLDRRSTLQSCWNQFQTIAKTENRPELFARCEPAIKRFELGLFRIVVMGEIKKGKTSFVNALLGVPDLLPVASDVATSVVYKVIYGLERKFKVFFKPDIDTGKSREPRTIEQSEIANYGTEKGNPNNQEQVDFIGVEEPNPLLKEGIVLIDTPGVGGMFKYHRDISWRYAPNADAIFFVLDSVEAVMSSDEVAFLKELKDRLKKQVFFVQTKIDAVDSEQAKSWRDRNQAILQEKVGIPKERIRYFPISSKLKNVADEDHDSALLEESGFHTLLDFIHRGLKAKKDEMLAAQVAAMLALPMNEIYTDLQAQQRMLQSKSNEEITTIRGELEKAKSDFARWERGTFQQETQNFRNDFEDIKRKYRRVVQEHFDPNGSLVTSLINELRESEFDPKMAVKQSEIIQQEWLSEVMQLFGSMQENYNNDVIALTSRLTSKLEQGMGALNTAITLADGTQTDSPMIHTDQIHMTFSTFETLRTGLYGGMAGGMMATGAVVLVSFVFPPAAALAVFVPWVGLLWGGKSAGDSMVARQREEFLSKLKQQLQMLAAQISRYAMNHFDDLGSSYERKIGDLFKTAIESGRQRLEKQSEETQQAIGRSREENAKLAESVKLRVAKVDHLLRQLKTMLPDVARA